MNAATQNNKPVWLAVDFEQANDIRITLFKYTLLLYYCQTKRMLYRIIGGGGDFLTISCQFIFHHIQ